MSESNIQVEIIEKLALLPQISQKVDQIHLAMYGNGNPQEGMLMRVAILEDARKELRKGWHGVLRWLKYVGTAILLILAGMWLGGCGVPSNTAQPTATVAPQITAADIQELKMDIKQIQTTIQTNNYALDGERATLARAEARDKHKLMLSWVGMLVGMMLLCFFTDSPVKGPKRWIAVLIAFSIIVGSLVVPLIWPW